MTQILIVEDEKDFKFFVQQYLDRLLHPAPAAASVAAAFAFSFAHDGQEALDMIQEKFFDIVVTDVRMPVMNGLRLLEEIRTVSPKTKTIVMSAYDDPQHIQHAMRLGALDFMTKPVAFNTFMKALENCYLRLQEEG